MPRPAPFRGAARAAALVALAAAAWAAGETRIDYLLRIDDPAEERVDVEARVSGLDEREDALELAMVEQYAYVRLAEPRLAGELRASASDGAPLAVRRVAEHRWRVATGGRREVALAWSIALDHRALPEVGVRSAYELPYVAADHGMLVTAALLAHPAREPYRASVAFALPEGWDVLAPWPQGDDARFHPADERDLVSNLVAIGSWSTARVAERGAEIVIAFAPGQPELERAVAPIIGPVLALELELFAARPFERYLVLFGRPDTPGLAGSPKTGAMTLSVQRVGDGPSALAPLVHLVAHEFFHTWTASRFDAPDELRFVSEGFSDFHAHLVPVLTGYARWEDFAAELGTAMSRWSESPRAGELSLVDAGGPPFFEDSAARQLVYCGGTVLAALFDAEIRRARPGATLIDLLRALYGEERWRLGGPAPKLADLERALAAFVGDERALALVDLARAREVPDLAARFVAAGADVSVTRAPASLELRANLDGTRVTAIDEADVGARLGLRAGDEILAVGGRAVRSAGEVHSGWRAQRDGRVRFRFRRGAEERDVDVPLPDALRFTVDPRTWYPVPTTVRPEDLPLAPGGGRR